MSTSPRPLSPGPAASTSGSPRSDTPSPATEVVERIFFDGNCGVCHWSVRFVAQRDPDGATFRFAPLGGEVYRNQLTEAQQSGLPDSLVVQTATGRILVQSDGVVYILRRLGGGWRWLGHLMALVPRPLRDFGYSRFAANRHRVAAKPNSACPLPSPELRSRLDP